MWLQTELFLIRAGRLKVLKKAKFWSFLESLVVIKQRGDFENRPLDKRTRRLPTKTDHSPNGVCSSYGFYPVLGA